jgi:hypothetical protein
MSTQAGTTRILAHLFGKAINYYCGGPVGASKSTRTLAHMLSTALYYLITSRRESARDTGGVKNKLTPAI